MAKALNNIDITAAQRTIITSLLGRYLPNTEVWAYGSRVKFTTGQTSDLDMVVFTSPEQSLALSDLREAFEESNLPFSVDILDWNKIPKHFHKNIETEYFVLQKKQTDDDLPDGWKIIPFKEFVEINPKETIKKGCIVKKVPMECLGDYRRKINSFNIEKYTGGTKFRNGDTLLSRITPCLENGKGAYVDILEDGEVGSGSTEYIVLREIPNQSNSKFIYYFSISPPLREVAIQSMTGTTGRQRVQTNVIADSHFQFPPLPEQKAIAKILGDIDDKIELNRQMSKTLEAMAQALFKSWFIDFEPVKAKIAAAKARIPKKELAETMNIAAMSVIAGKTKKELATLKKQAPKTYKNLYQIAALFPSEMQDSKLGQIPKGWGISTIGNLANIMASGGTPSTRNNNYYGGNINWFSTKELLDCYLIKSNKTITQEGFENSAAKLFPKNTVVMAIYASPTVGRLGILSQESTFNQAAVGIYAKEKFGFEFIYLLLYSLRNKLNALTNGAAQQNLNVGIVKNYFVLVADEAIHKEFKIKLAPIFKTLEFITKEIQNLTEIRDTLLPKLISGKVRVSTANNKK